MWPAELGVERADELTLIARELAWSPRTPEDEEVEEFAEQALGAQEEAVVRIPTFHRGVAVPLADLPRLHGAAQRTSLVRLLLVAALATTLAWLFVVAESAGAGRAAVFPEGASTGVVALDMSASISGPIYARVATTLRGIVNANQSVGLDHVLRHGVRASAAELAAGRDAPVHSVLHAAPLLRQHARVRPDAVGHVHGRHARRRRPEDGARSR